MDEGRTAGLSGLMLVRLHGQEKEGSLQSHGVEDKLHGQESSVGGDTVGVGWEALGVDAVFLNQVPHHLVQHGGPNGSGVVHGWLSSGVVCVDYFVGKGVGGQAGGVKVSSDSGGSEANPCTHGFVGCAFLALLEVDGDRHEVSPSFSHTTGLVHIQAVGVCWTTGKAGGHTMCVFVNDHASIETAVTIGDFVVPDEHGHSAWLTIDGGGEVGVVESSSILSIENDSVTSLASLAIVVGLEVTCGFVESEVMENIMVHV